MSRANVMLIDDFNDIKPKKYEKGFLEIRLTSWSHFPNIVRKFHNNQDYIWRGQRNENWPLLSIFDRVLSIKNRKERKNKSKKLYNIFTKSILGHRGSSPPKLDMHSA